MSNFICEHCGVTCIDEGPGRGYVTGCEHYPPDNLHLRKSERLGKIIADGLREFADRIEALDRDTSRRPRIVMLPPGVTLEQAQRVLDASEPQDSPQNPRP